MKQRQGHAQGKSLCRCGVGSTSNLQHSDHFFTATLTSIAAPFSSDTRSPWLDPEPLLARTSHRSFVLA